MCSSEGVSTLAPALLPAVTRLRLDTEKCVGGGVAVCRSPPPEDCPTQRSSPCRDITQGQGQQGHLASSRRWTWDICMRWNGWDLLVHKRKQGWKQPYWLRKKKNQKLHGYDYLDGHFFHSVMRDRSVGSAVNVYFPSNHKHIIR